MAKIVVITGGVVSSLGKGIAAASLGLLLKARGLRVTLQKLDPYLNIDPGTMSPFQHGEVFVTDDGAETDLDLGHYERFTGASVTRGHNVTAGQVYDAILSKERRGDYLGRTVQVIPHVTDEIKQRITGLALATQAQVHIVEIGGTVGDIESLPFLESVRQLKLEHRRDVLFVHVTLLPYIKAAGEMKTKPTQHSVKELREIGIQPDVLLCRSEAPLTSDLREKIALFCNVPTESVIDATDVESIYDVPLVFHRGGLDAVVARELSLDGTDPDLGAWNDFLDRVHHPSRECLIGVVGCAGWKARTWSSAGPPSSCARWTASSFPAGSASAASRARSRRRAGRGSGACRISGCASACRSPRSSSRVTWWAGWTPTPASSTRRPSTR